MTRLPCITAFLVALLVPCLDALGELRFPPPEFESGYRLPEMAPLPAARPAPYEYADAALLVAGLLLASYLILRRRSRRAVFALMIGVLFYFGFVRNGCVCQLTVFFDDVT